MKLIDVVDAAERDEMLAAVIEALWETHGHEPWACGKTFLAMARAELGLNEDGARADCVA